MAIFKFLECTTLKITHVSLLTAFWVLLLLMIYFGFLAILVSIETFFLLGELEEEIYIECLHGIKSIGKDAATVWRNALPGERRKAV